jgi:predicted metal-dependent hydrolase
MNKINFNGIEVEHICKPSLKNSYINISKDAKVILKTPRVSSSYIETLLLKKESWIRKHLLNIEINKPKEINIEDEVLLFGEVYSVDAPEARLLNESLQRLRISSLKNIHRCYDDFYKELSKSYLTTRLEYFSNIMNLKYSEVKYKKLKRRWGSCDSKKVITLNIQLLKIDKDLIDYVIVHELAHLVHMNHSKKFHQLVENYIPNAKDIVIRLRDTNII